MRRPAAKTLVLDLLGTMRPGASMPVAALVEAAELFGIPEGTVRVALVRLLGADRIARDERGRYRLGDSALPVGRRVRGWRDLGGRVRPWRSGWIGVVARDGARRADRQRGRVLRLFGLAPLDRRLWLRADNLTASVEEVRAELQGLGLPSGDVVARLDDFDADTEACARGLWDVRELRRGYRASLARLAASTARLGRLSGSAAMVESFLVGGEILRSLVLDPLLPDAICPSHERTELLERMRDYDRTGRVAWAALLRRHDVPAFRAPIDARLETPAVPLGA